MKKIYFDMDGTIANLYAVSGWLADLNAEKVRPYAEALPLVNMSHLTCHLNRLQKAGYKIGIISWLSKNGTDKYNQAVKETKMEWLRVHLASVQFDEIHIVKYGTPKQTIGKGILFDDEEQNRKNWGKGAYQPEKIFDVLGGLK